MKYIKMLFITVLTMVSLVACGGGGGGGNGNSTDNNEKAGKITFYDDHQVVDFNLNSDGSLKGIISEKKIFPEEEILLIYNSDRVKWLDLSSAKIDFIDSFLDVCQEKTKVKLLDQKISVVSSLPKTFLKCTIPGTANNDRGTWSLKLKNSDYAWFNVDAWDYAGKPWKKVTEFNLIEYGDYKVPEIIFYDSTDTAGINFGSNIISGFVTAITPDQIEWIQWNSDRVGWNEHSYAKTDLKKDTTGNYYVRIGVPADDKGNFSAKLKDGTFVWLNINAGWKYSSNITLDQQMGQIQYKLF